MSAADLPLFRPRPELTEATRARAKTQLEALRAEMVGRVALYTLAEIVRLLKEHHGVHATEASVSARLRDLRRPEHGAHRVDREEIKPGLFAYRVGPPGSETLNVEPRKSAAELRLERRIAELEARIATLESTR